MVFNATSSNISVISLQSALLVEETVVPGENHSMCSKVSVHLTQGQEFPYNCHRLDLIIFDLRYRYRRNF
jgi:hypothetical protein